MNVPSLQNAPASHFVPQVPPSNTNNFVHSSQLSTAKTKDYVVFSELSLQLMTAEQAKPSVPAVVAVPESQRPRAQQSADTILGFIGQQLEKKAGEGASDKELEKILVQGLKGFKKGVSDAYSMIKGLGLMSDDIRESITDTKSLVFKGVEELRDTYLGTATTSNVPEEPVQSSIVFKQLSAYSESRLEGNSIISRGAGEQKNTANIVQTAAAVYTQRYQSNQSVELAVKTHDGDIITLSFSSDYHSSSRISAFLSHTGKQALGVQAYQSHVNSHLNFSFGVQGYLDSDETEALYNLLAQVTELTDTLFNGDFEAALSLASQFEMDTLEFSALSLDIARSTYTSVTQAYTSATNVSVDESRQQQVLSGLDIIGQMLELLPKLVESAEIFDDSKLLLADLFANQVAQNTLMNSGFNGASIAHLLDGLLESLV